MSDDDTQLLKRQMSEIHDALIGTIEKPGALRILEKHENTLYGSDENHEDGIEKRVKRMEEKSWQFKGILTAIASVPVIIEVVKFFRTTKQP